MTTMGTKYYILHIYEQLDLLTRFSTIIESFIDL